MKNSYFFKAFFLCLPLLVTVLAGMVGSVTAATSVEPLTDHSREVFAEFGHDPFEVPDAVRGVDFVQYDEPDAGRGENFDPFDTADASREEDYDPLEPYNALIFEFNYRLDKYALKPIAQGYNFLMPNIAQEGIRNAILNIRFAPRMLNNLFQAKFKGAGIEMSRFLLNSTVGIGGFFDPAKSFFDLETPLEDTGQTLGAYGVPPGAYIVLPFLGPSNVRDMVGFVGDVALDPFNWLVLPIIEIDGAPLVIDDNTTISLVRWGIQTVKIINFRSLNLEKFQGVEDGTLDLYGAVRNGYLQQRAKDIQE